MRLNELKRECLGPEKMDGCHAILIGNKISVRITKLFFAMGLTANFATSLMIIFGLLGCFLIIFNDVSAFFGGILIWFSTLLDQVDGQLARLYKTANIHAFFYDQMFHLITFSFFFMALSVNLYKIYDCAYIFVFPIIAVFGIVFKRELMTFPSFAFFAKMAQKKYLKQQKMIAKNLVNKSEKIRISVRCLLRTALTEFEIYSLIFVVIAFIDLFFLLDLKIGFLIVFSVLLLIDYLDYLRSFIKDDVLSSKMNQLIEQGSEFYNKEA